MHRLKAALDRTCAQRRPGLCWPHDALELPLPEVLKLEEITKTPSRTLGDDDRVEVGDALQARAARFGVSPTISCLSAPLDPHEVADHKQAGGDPNAHLERLGGRRRGDGIDQCKAGANRATVFAIHL
jgi:hypothetical protein